MATYKPIRKTASGTEEIKIPYAVLADPPTIPDISGLMPKKGGTFTGEVKFGSTENFQGYYIKRMIGSLGAGTAYNNLDTSYKDGTWHRMWRLRFPSGSNFWGKIKITLYGGYSSFNASGVMSKSITCNFNTSTIYNNVGCYDGLGVNVEQDFRISEAIWNDTASAWEVLIWQKNLNGNNSPVIMLECWTTNNTKYINAFNGIAAQTVELTQSTSYSANKASSTGGTKTVEWATLPVYENPLGEEIATVQDISGKANLSGGNTFSGLQKVNAPTNSSGTEQATAKFKTSNGGSITFGKEGANSGTMIRLDQTDGTCRLRFRSSATAGAMVWEQPEQGANLYIDLGKSGADYHRITFPASAGTLALTSQIPTSSTVSNWGFTKNTGTVTSVAVKMNGATKGTVTSSGTIDLGTVLTNDGGTINKSKTVKMDASANSDGANLKWGTVNSKNPYIGYASDQVDGTFVVGSLLGTNYASGLAIGGGSGNLLWKGAKVATTSDIPNISGKLDKSAFSLSGTTLTITI